MIKEHAISISQGTWGFLCGVMYANTQNWWIFVLYGVGVIILRFAVDGIVKA